MMTFIRMVMVMRVTMTMEMVMIEGIDPHRRTFRHMRTVLVIDLWRCYHWFCTHYTY